MRAHRKIKVIQFGEGGFLRGFADWMLQKLNDAGLFEGGVAVVQPIDKGMCDALVAQDCVYTHLCRGAEGVEETRIDVIERCVKPYEDLEEYLALAAQKEARFILSNTTEAGIAFVPSDRQSDRPPSSFPGKLTLLLYRRFTLGLPGFVLLPCELIDKNGEKLKDCVLRYAALWQLGEAFCTWVEQENVFCNTLVDRINTGYPKEEAEALGYGDPLLNTSEYFHLWVIESAHDLEAELPLQRAGLNVILTKNELERYRTRKVRILNGAHTAMVPHALLCGLSTVRDCMEDEGMHAFLSACLAEIMPTLDLPQEELAQYAADVLTRFKNPYIKHYLRAISLNSISKFRVRVLPSLLAYRARFGCLPPNLCFSLARLITFYKTDEELQDDPTLIARIKEGSLAQILSDVELWGEDLSFCLPEVEKHANSPL